MYTFAPLADINTVDNHVGFFIICLIVLCTIWLLWVNDEVYDSIGILLTFGLILLISGAISWNSGTVLNYANTQIIAKFVRYETEGYSEYRRSGKSTNKVDVHNVYVIYNVDGNDILFPAKVGMVYPKEAIVYKN